MVGMQRNLRTLTILVLGAALGACSSSTSTSSTTSAGRSTTSTPAASTTSEPATTTTVARTAVVRVYLLRGETLGVAHRNVVSSVPADAMKELLAGPNAADRAAGLTTAVPAGVQLLGLTQAGDIATVDLTGAYASGGGSLSMRNRIAQVVFTLTQFPAIKAVRFSLDGHVVSTIGGEGYMVDKPQHRVDLTAALPNILIEEPAPNDSVGAALKVSGMADTFEATVNYRIVDANGAVLVKGVTTATAGTGTWGTFSVTINRPAATTPTGAVVVYDISARDGSEIDKVSIPVRFTA
jgi:germination protein M